MLVTLLNSRIIGNFMINKMLKLLEKNVGIKLSYAKATGDIWRCPNFNQVRIIFPSGDSIRASSISFAYNPIALLSGRWHFNRITISSPEIYWHSIRVNREIQTQSVSGKRLTEYGGPLFTIANFIVTDGKIFLNSELRVANCQTTITANSTRKLFELRLRKFSCRLLKEKLTITEAAGIFSYDGSQLNIDTVSVKTQKSQMAFKGKVNLTNPEYGIQISSLSLDLAELTNAEGKLTAQGKFNISKTYARGKINLVTDGVVIQKISLPNFWGKLTLTDGVVKYILKTVDGRSVSLQADGIVNLFDLSYEGEINFQNLAPTAYFPLSIPQFRLNGVISLNGIRTDTIRLKMKSHLLSLKETVSSVQAIDSLFLDLVLNKSKVVINQIKLAKVDKEAVINGFWAKNSVNLNYKLSNFPAKIIEEIFNLKLAGTISGFGKIAGGPDSLSAMANLNWQESTIEPISFKKAQLEFNVSNLRRLWSLRPGNWQNINKNLTLAIDTLFVAKKEIGNLVLHLDDTIFNLMLKNTNLSLLTKGTIVFDRNSFWCEIKSLVLTRDGETFQTKAPFRIEQSNQQFKLIDFTCNLAGGELNLDLILRRKSIPNINLVMKNVALGKLQKFLEPFKQLELFNGIASLELKTNKEYELNFRLTGINNPGLGINLDSIIGMLTMSQNTIKFNNLCLVRKTFTSTIAGSVNYSFDVKNRKVKLGDLDLKITLVDPGVWVLSFLRGILDIKTGSVYGTIEVKGDVQNPTLNGRAVVNDAELEIVATKSKVTKVNAELILNQNRIVLSKISGQAGRGLVTASGWTELAGLTKIKSLHYEIKGQDLPIHPQKDIFAVVSGDLEIAMRENEPTSLQGNIKVSEALLTIGFGGEANGATSSNLTYNISVKGERGIWLRNANCDIELAIDLNLRKTLTEIFYSGNLKSRRGNFYYLDHNFNLTEGIIKFDNINELNPELSLQGEKYTRPLKLNSGASERIKLVLQLTGSLKEPIFNFKSEPPILSQEDIITYLTLNVTTQEISAAEQQAIFNKLVSERFLGYFERELAKRLRNYLKIDYLQFESGLFEGGKTTKVTVGKYIAPNLYTTYTHNVANFSQDIFRIEYYITKSQELVGERDEQGRYRFKYQFKFRY